MANGFHGTTEEWNRLESPLRRLDGTLGAFASRHNLALTKNERGWPDRAFQWGTRPRILIQVFLENEGKPTYAMWVSASDDRSRADFWEQKTLLKATSIEALERQLPELLEVAWATATKWIEAYNAAG